MIYIHVPFCRSFCTYCGFYSEVCSKENDAMEQFAEAMVREIEVRKDEISNHAVNSKNTLNKNTLYIGGGTPSVLPLSVLGHIVEALPVSKDWEEFTIEVNPDDIIKGGLDYALGLKALGVTRVSMGIQSFDASVLKWMNRRHSADDGIMAFNLLREAGFDNISIDLIFGYGDSAVWGNTLQRAIELHPEHMSAYQLSIEPDSALERQVALGRFSEADEELCRHQYDMLCKALADAGYVHYEVSNFALPGREARHNSGYWDHSAYVGLGPAAHSFDLASLRRSWNAPDLSSYISMFCNDGVVKSAVVNYENLTPEQLAIEDVMLGLRTALGVPSALIRSTQLDRLLVEGALVELPNGNVRIPEDHFFVSDDIIASLV